MLLWSSLTIQVGEARFMSFTWPKREYSDGAHGRRRTRVRFPGNPLFRLRLDYWMNRVVGSPGRGGKEANCNLVTWVLDTSYSPAQVGNTQIDGRYFMYTAVIIKEGCCGHDGSSSRTFFRIVFSARRRRVWKGSVGCHSNVTTYHRLLGAQ